MFNKGFYFFPTFTQLQTTQPEKHMLYEDSLHPS